MLLNNTKTDIIIDETIEKIKVHAGFLRLYTVDGILGDVPIYQIESIIILGSNIDIPARLIKLCSQEKIPLHILTNLKKYFGSLNFGVDKFILNRQSQYRACLSEKWRLFLAKHILYQKLKTQNIAINYWTKSDINTLEQNIINIKSSPSSQSLNGIEGKAATIYWNYFGNQIYKKVKDFTWVGRKKNPTLDPINSLLSLSYGLLATQVQTDLSLIGFDPYFGILHTTSPNRPGLTYDIMEIYRVFIVDLWVLELFKQKIFIPEDFTFTKEGICTLVPHKKNDFFKLWFKRIKYFEFTTNKGDLSIHDFLKINSTLLLKWFDLINTNEVRDTGRVDRLTENLLVFEDINQFIKI
jgi:CRISP-associated protein Cas1